MRITPDQIRQLIRILERIDEGKISVPRIRGPIGEFIRQYAGARETVAARLAVELPERGWISGDLLGPVDLTPITPMENRPVGDLIGSVNSTIAASESAAMAFRVVLWGAARTANALVRTWRRNPLITVSLNGPYRCYLPNRITPGEASTSEQSDEIGWDRLRCLKYTGDDVGRAPHASAYHVDWSIGRPGVKALRTVALRRVDRIWNVLPGLLERPSETAIHMPEELFKESMDQVLALVYAEPWTPSSWTAVEARQATDDDILAHSIAWADHIRELSGESPPDGPELRALASRLREAGLAPNLDAATSLAPMRRSVADWGRSVGRWLRGIT